MKNTNENIRNLWSEALDEETQRRYGMSKHHPPEDCPQWFIDQFDSTLSNQRSEIEKQASKLKVNASNTSTIYDHNDYVRYDKLVALLNSKDN